MAALTIGVDVGGTNTDAVIIKNADVLCSAKTPTTADVTSGLEQAISSAINNLPNEYSRQDIQRVNIGTTHFVNAVVQRRDIVPVAVLRLCGPACRSIPPFADFPEDLRKVIAGPCYNLQGGFEFDGQRVISDVDDKEISRVAREIEEKGIKNVVITGVFSPVCAEQEKHVEKVLLQSCSSISLTLSHEVGLIGFLERENASILNESLKPLCSRTVTAFQHALQRIKLQCPFYLTQNDGTIIRAQKALDFPVLTFASGPTNSMRGAAHLSQMKDAIVVDIGGTTTDIGVLNSGFPRQSSTRVKVGGVNTNFRMPDVLSIGLGGGSHVVKDADTGRITVGPRSVGYQLENESRVFGGNVLTATDIAVSVSSHDLGIGDRTKVEAITKDFKMKSVDVIKKMIEDAIDQVKTSKQDQPVVLVGGGTILVDTERWHIKGTSSFKVPPYSQSANAVGAALSKVSGRVDKVFSLENQSEQEVKREAEVLARETAVKNGADPNTVEIIDKSAVKLAYLPGNAIRIQVKAVGDLSEHENHNPSKDFQSSEQQMDADGTLCKPSYSASRPVQPNTDTTSTTTTTTTTCINTEPHIDPDTTTTTTCINTEPHIDPDTTTTTTCINTEPHIDPDTGDWLLSGFDVECMAIGAGILGCGGGGNPYIGKLRILELLKAGKEIRIIHPDRLGTSPSLSGPVGMAAFMGAPVICIEKISTGLEATLAFQALKQKNEFGLDKPLNVVVCAEIGGLNSMEPLAVAAELGIPVVDADGMGRAFPELQMLTPFVYGCRPYPASIADDKGNVLVMNKVQSSKTLENLFRVLCVEMGCSAGISALFPAEDVKTKCVLYSLSRVRRLGNHVLQARKNKTSPIDTILAYEGGKMLYKGKIADVERKTIGGFNKGIITIEGASQEPSLFVEFQNENYIAYSKNKDDTKNVVACVPDLISLVDCETGEPIPTEEVRYGLHVAVLAMCVSPLWTTPKGLKTVGPAAFGYKDLEYKPIGDYIEHPPIPQPQIN